MTNRKYTEPKIYPKSHDLKKVWYVAFRFYNDVTGKMQEFQYRNDINTFDSVAKRLVCAKVVAKSLKELLSEGWNPFDRTIETEEEAIPKKNLLETLDDILTIVNVSLTEKSRITYRDIRNQFVKWLVMKKYDRMMPDSFHYNKARAYIDYCLVERNYSGKTHNVHLGFLKAFFTKMVDRKIIAVNPFASITELTEKMNENIAFTDDERERVRNHLKKHNKRLYFAVQFVYYCFLRRTELRALRVGDINLNQKSIRVPGRNAKNGRSESATIPKSFEPVLLEMGIDKLPKHFYVFGRDLESCDIILPKTDYFTDPHREELRLINIRKDCTFYSWKHTGAAQLYLATKDPYVVMRQCRHTDIKTTMIYLRSLGLIVDEVVRNADFEF